MDDDNGHCPPGRGLLRRRGDREHRLAVEVVEHFPVGREMLDERMPRRRDAMLRDRLAGIGRQQG
ncbi:hypothetical protein KBTX_01660 [wastewater metagenome]|uniref:Uncharacterized protein n=2 Tax=unclassified sequences TaxID=12908 RepID=A0A5B8R9D0_9ZZZZ|nr:MULTISPECIES: hypothetical protein [Arhodomonas]MCS4506000.1 hypothetical protein [Arhodomonas aquaeolei]QEA05340.1 hypothetical protein KBTEX_01660 [uncultured organism]